MQGKAPVTKCDMENCFYNNDLQCHALAINIGGDHPACDTFISEKQHITRTESSLVGACHVSHCKFNADLLCNASGIVVGHHADHADCETFTAR